MTTQRSAIEDWPPHHFRPPAECPTEPGREPPEGTKHWPNGLWRYDESTDAMVPDDGKPALAYTSLEGGCSMVYYSEPPHDSNYLGSWEEEVGPGDQGSLLFGCRQSFKRCMATRDGEDRRGDDYPDYESHPNIRAKQTAWEFHRGRRGAGNGRSIPHSHLPPRGPLEYGRYPSGSPPPGLTDCCDHELREAQAVASDAQSRFDSELSDAMRRDQELRDAHTELEDARRELETLRAERGLES